MNTNIRRVFVSGADGFIGSHFVEYLLAKGYEVKALCLYNSLSSYGWLENSNSLDHKNLQIILGDIRDGSFISKETRDCDAIVNLAALISIPHSYGSSKSYIDTNIVGTYNVLTAANDNNINKTVIISTSETYGTAQTVPISEEHPLTAQSPYAATKIAADQLALSYSRSYGTPVVIARPFNTYGPRQSARAVIPAIITQIINGKREIKLGDTSTTRDFNYVNDTCAGIEACMLADRNGDVLNIASGYEISIADTINIIATVCNANVNVVYDEERIRPKNSEVLRLVGDSSKIKKLTNWKPEYHGEEGFIKGIKETVEWFKSPTNMAFYKPDTLVL